MDIGRQNGNQNGRTNIQTKAESEAHTTAPNTQHPHTTEPGRASFHSRALNIEDKATKHTNPPPRFVFTAKLAEHMRYRPSAIPHIFDMTLRNVVGVAKYKAHKSGK